MKTVTWGILGCGNVCEKKAGPALYGVEHSRLAAVMRRDVAKAEDFARRHDVPRWYGGVEDLLADSEVEVVYVATPDAAHEEGTLAAARAGKHVLVEKAMATNTPACDRMIAACREAGVTLAVAYYRRCYPTILRAKALMEAGEIGDVESIYLNDEFPLSHRLDLCHFFLGDMSEVSADDEPLPPCSNAATGPMLHCRHQGGGVSMTPAGWDENLVPEMLDIRGRGGRILIMDLKAGKLIIEKDGKRRKEDVGPLPATHWGLVENFVLHLNGKATLACDGIEGRKSTVILDIVEALKPDGRPVKVEY
ncbi:MAG: Gfo/Idh/MocA family oxidoreductase [Phycisphaeraceae bacterium]|nr:Gfo/Idh/MocA family oxidoreductase [Phycisphaeraceae bacterium]